MLYSGVCLASILSVALSFEVSSDQFVGVYCAPIYTSPERLKPSINIELITANDDLKLSVFVVKNKDLVDVNFPLFSDYSQHYPIDTAQLICGASDEDCEAGKFRVPNAPTLSYNDVVSKSVSKKEYSISESGVHCVYVQPSDPEADFKVNLNLVESYGYLNIPLYILLSAYTYVNLMGAVVVGFISYYIFVVRKDFGRLSIISHSSYFLILLPFFCINLVRSFCLTLINKYDNFAIKILQALFEFLTTAFKFYLNWAFLIFMNGYGILFHSLSDIEPANRRKSYILLFGSTISVAGASLFSQNIAAFFILVWSLTFFIISISAYRNTKKVIGESSIPESAKLFKWSFYLVVIFPIFMSFVVIFVLGFFSFKSLTSMGPDVSQREIMINALEMAINSTPIYSSFLMEFCQFYIIMIFIFVIWIKENQGLKKEQFEGGNGYRDDVSA